MNEQNKLQNISDNEASELAEACRMAYGHPAMDAFMDEVFFHAQAAQARMANNAQEHRLVQGELRLNGKVQP